MIIKTRKLPPSSTDGARMRATSETGAVLTIPYPHESSDPNWEVAHRLSMALGHDRVILVVQRGNSRRTFISVEHPKVYP